MSKTKAFVPLLALMLCLGAILFPVTAFAQTTEDTTPPTVTAVISGENLNVTAKDDVGVAAVYINGHRFSTLADGTASIYLKDYAGTGAKVEVYATDTAGNRSQTVVLDNPFYQAPQSTPAPSAPSVPSATSTPKPTSTPSAISTPSASSTPAPSSSDSGGSGTGTGSSDGETGTESAIGTGDSVTTPGGTGTVTEVATDKDGKLFYTIETPAGNVFYLVIDMARTDGKNVYFLNAVTEDDLLALAETDGSTTGGVSAIPTPTPEPEPTPEPTPDPETEEEPEKESGGNGMGSIIFIILAAAAVGGAGYYFKILKPRQQAAAQDAEEYENGEFDDLDDEADAEYHFTDEEEAYYSDGDEDPDEEPFDNE